MDKQKKRTTMKKYRKPSVISYGDIRQATQAIANNSMNADGGAGKTSKTA